MVKAIVRWINIKLIKCRLYDLNVQMMFGEISYNNYETEFDNLQKQLIGWRAK